MAEQSSPDRQQQSVSRSAKKQRTLPAQQTGSGRQSNPASSGQQGRPGKAPSAGRSPARPARSSSNSKSGSRKSSSNSRSKNNSIARSLPDVQGVRVKSRTPPRESSTNRRVESAWMKRVQKDLPPYADEVLAFLLIAVGLLSFLTLLSPSSGQLGSAWSDLLRTGFGLGSFVISGLIMAAGTILLLPKLGIAVRFNWWRVITGELFFVFLLAYIHSSIRWGAGGDAGRVEAFARAIEGRGGGMVGWALQEVIHMLLGDVITGTLLLLFLFISGLGMLGIRRHTIIETLTRFYDWLDGIATRLGPMQLEPVEELIVETAEPAIPRRQITVSTPIERVTAGPLPIVETELPSLPGRPSIVTGASGAGANTGYTPARKPAYLEEDWKPRSLKEQIREELDEEVIKMRFKLDRRAERRRSRKRSDRLPPMELLGEVDFQRPSDEEVNVDAEVIERTIADFGMNVEVVGVKAGPTITQYAVQPFSKVDRDGKKVIQRVRVTRVAALSNDLSLALQARSIRIQAPVPGTNYIGVEVPNVNPGIVSLRPVMESDAFLKIKSPLAIALGREVDGAPFAADLGKMPHMLIGGTTGAGKSVCLRSIATCLVTNNRPDQLNLIMIDPKMVELVRFNGLPHLLGHVEVQIDRIIGVLRWVTREMDRRYKLMEEARARNIATYNHGKRGKGRLPHMVVLIDELAELMSEHPDETEHLITRLAQMARATGIHLIVATQRPSTDVVTGLIKANFPARISFAVASGIDSRVIIDAVGAEDLIGRGDLLYQGADAMAPVRLQGCFVGDREMEHIVDFWRDNWDEEELEEEEPPWERSLTRMAILDSTDPMLLEAIRIVQFDRVASASQLQRKLNVGYPRAGRIIDSLYRLGVVGPEQTGGRLRKVLIPKDAEPGEFIVEQQRKNKQR